MTSLVSMQISPSNSTFIKYREWRFVLSFLLLVYIHFIFWFNLFRGRNQIFQVVFWLLYMSKPVDFYMESVILLITCFFCTFPWSCQWEFQLYLPFCVFLHLFRSFYLVIWTIFCASQRFRKLEFQLRRPTVNHFQLQSKWWR